MFVDRQLSAEHEECPDPVRSQCPEFMVLVDLVNFGTDPNNPNFADVATALGIHDHGVERPDEPAEALGAASTTPARPLVEAMTTQSNGPTVHDTPRRARCRRCPVPWSPSGRRRGLRTIGARFLAVVRFITAGAACADDLTEARAGHTPGLDRLRANEQQKELFLADPSDFF